jgi:thioredoxin 1
MSVVNLTKQTFENEVLKTDKTVLIDFWAAWCGPCKMLTPVIHQLSEEVSEEYKIAKVNVDEERDLAMKFGVSSIPTIVVVKNGKVVNQAVGYRPLKDLKKLLGL